MNPFLRWSVLLILGCAAGCSEGTKPNPLPRAGIEKASEKREAKSLEGDKADIETKQP